MKSNLHVLGRGDSHGPSVVIEQVSLLTLSGCPFRELYRPEVPEEALTTTTLLPPVDIYEDEHNIILKMEVPGIDQKDIDVRIQNNTLTVHGERKIEKEEKEENFRRVERQYGSFTRSFTLPSSVDPGQVSAHCDNGVLIN